MSVSDEKDEKGRDDDEVEVCTKGVSIPFLVSFAKTIDPKWTTTDVCVEHVLPKTKGEEKAYFELDPDEEDENGNKVIGDATYFCSHAWRYKFVDVVDALQMFCHRKHLKPEETFIWFDLFVNNQHRAPNLSYKWWCGRFKEAIRSFGKVVLVLQPWTDPIPITRAWCLWEIFCTIDTGSEFNVAMCAEQHRDFKTRLVTNFEDIRLAMSKIDARRADAWNKKDRDKIFAAIEDAVGFAKLNESVIGKMRDWLLEAGQAHLKETVETLGENDVQTLETYNCLGKLYRDMNKYDKAEELFSKALRGFANTSGEDSASACRVKNNLAFSLQKQDKLEDAITMHESCLCSRRKHFGDEHSETAQTMSNLATAFRMVGKMARAKELFQKAVECREKLEKMGRDHPATLYTVSQYALTLSECKEFEDASENHKRAIEGLHKFFNKLSPDGRKHPLTLMAIHNMGHHLHMMEKNDDALQYLLEAYRGRLEKLGETAKATLESKEMLFKVVDALEEAGNRPEINLSAKGVETYLRQKETRRKLWLKASNYLAFKDRLRLMGRASHTYSERDWEGSSIGNNVENNFAAE